MIGVVCFVPDCRGCIVRLNSDNSNAVAWLQKSRCAAGVGIRILAAIELYKRKYGVKILTRFIEGVANTSADCLSRGKIPHWLKRFGVKAECNLEEVAGILNNPLTAWRNILL